MPRYYFHIENEPRDEEGREIESMAAAKCEAVRFLGQLICDSSDHFWDSSEAKLTVTDEQGLVLFTLQLIGTDAPAIAGR